MLGVMLEMYLPLESSRWKALMVPRPREPPRRQRLLRGAGLDGLAEQLCRTVVNGLENRLGDSRDCLRLVLVRARLEVQLGERVVHGSHDTRRQPDRVRRLRRVRRKRRHDQIAAR